MKTVDRVMRAYLTTRKLTDEQAAFVRAEIAKFIDELMAKTTREAPTSSDR